MNEMSYADALDAGLEPISCRAYAVESLGEGQFGGCLDALVWPKRQPCLLALLTLDTGVRVQVVGFPASGQLDLRGLGPTRAGLRRLSIICQDALENSRTVGVEPEFRHHEAPG